MRGFRQLSHTADVKIEAWGADISIALVECVRGFTSVVTEVATIDANEEHAVAMSADTREKLLYDLIDQLVYLKDTAAFLASDATFVVSNDGGTWQLTGTLRGRSLHGHQLDDVKAMTYHDMKIEETIGKVTIVYVVDL